MKRHHLAIFTQMGNGHLFPFVGLCTELVARGYRVTFPATERYSRNVSAAGGEVIAFTERPIDTALQAENERRSRLPLDDPSRFDATELEWTYFVSKNEEILAQLIPFYQRDPPDLLLYNRYCFPGRIVARHVGASTVQVSPHFAYPGATRYWQNGVSVSPPGIAAYAERMDAFLANHGLEQSGNLWHLEDLNVHLIPREFQYCPELFDDRFMFAGRSIESRNSVALGAGPFRGPTILISGYSGLPETQFSDASYFKVFIDALGNTDCRCILSIGDRTSPESLGALPKNFELNRYMSNTELLPYVNLFACHGGMGSTLEALYCGVPVLTVPSTPYTNEVAYRVADLGVGTSLSPLQFSTETVRETVISMTGDTELIARTQRMQDAFRSSSGLTAAVSRIDEKFSHG